MHDPVPTHERVPLTNTEGVVTRYRLERPRPPIVETSSGHFEATRHAENREGWRGRRAAVRDRAFGSALSNARLEAERLTVPKALAVFSSDAISSVAYATQEILFVLVLAGPAATTLSLPIAMAIVALLGIVVVSYRQTITEYPSGGGAYIVARENLGTTAGLAAASALLIDYVLTVSVSIAAGIDALASLNPEFRPYAVECAVALVALVGFINLRGMRESGTIFAIPTYAFVAVLGTAIVVALTRIVVDGESPLTAGPPREETAAVHGLTMFLVLRAFANGCTAMTGVEAISNGVQAFRAPSAVNANRALALMAVILGSLFLGVTLIARHHGFVPSEDSTIPSQLGVEAFGAGSPLFALLQLMTAAILVLAANTAFADFPRLAAILARDGFLPRTLQARGNRLVFTSGVTLLSLLAAALIIAFEAETTRLIPLYALGVFLSFTLSQSGMVLHWRRTRAGNWRKKALTSGFGAVATGLVTGVILVAKFSQGAWVIIIVLPLIALGLLLVWRFHRRLRRNLFVPPEAILDDLSPRGDSRVPILVPAVEIDLAVVMALGVACERSRDVRAIHVAIGPDDSTELERRWRAQIPGVPLLIIDSPYRIVADPIASYAEDLAHEPPYHVEIIVPVVDVRHRYERPLVNQALKQLPRMLAGRPRISVTLFRHSEGGPRRRRWARRR